MSDLIDRAELLDAFEDADADVMADYGYEYGSECGFSRCAVRDVINNAPTVQPVVRCRDCKWYGPNNYGRWYDCSMSGCNEEEVPCDDDFCSHGERRNDNAE